ncbi:hypothetical protein AB0I49_00825 [Streptomyces sp. NPDC050617]|uniref:hypothetical protein n=1 Tax=Streptomyces sp. NPDC050617 TaxID=3154628 RepID=UPI003419BED4
MDALVLAAGTAVVGAMATDAWQAARSGVVAWWRRVRPEEAEEVDAALAQVRPRVLAARQAGDTADEEALVSDWRVRLERLVRADQRLAQELRTLLDDELTPALPAPEQSRVESLVMKASASGHGRVYQAGRDQHITER